MRPPIRIADDPTHPVLLVKVSTPVAGILEQTPPRIKCGRLIESKNLFRNVNDVEWSEVKELLALRLEHSFEIERVVFELPFFVTEHHNASHVRFGVIKSPGFHDRFQNQNRPVHHYA